MQANEYAAQARARKTAEALAIGIDDALISNLVESFYRAVRGDDLLGPIFEKHVADWPVHLGRMKDFWASVTLESGRFRGSPMAKHIAVPGIDAEHFERWLMLWHRSLEAVTPEARAAEVFSSAAQRIADSLLTGIRINRDGLQPAQAKTGA